MYNVSEFEESEVGYRVYVRLGRIVVTISIRFNVEVQRWIVTESYWI